MVQFCISIGATAVFTGILLPFVCGFAVIACSSTAQADQALFDTQCGICHTLSAAESPRQGPNLQHIIGRLAGSQEGFPYSSSVKALGLNWTPELMDRWLQHPQSVAKDSYMMYRQDDAQIRTALIQFLSSQPN